MGEEFTHSEFFKNLRDSELEDILVQSYRSTKILAKVFFPDRFYGPFCSLHDSIFDLLDSKEQLIAIAAPRGIGKTSLIGLALAAKQIIFRDSHFIPYVSTSFAVAGMQTENLKRELVTNVLIKKFFGKIKTRGASEEGIDESFSKEAWVAKLGDDKLGTFVLPRGSGQQIRGVLYKNFRPDFFIVDDFEDKETITNDNIRQKNKEWFTGDLMKAVSRFDKGWRIIYIDTVKHEDALLIDLIESDEWCSVRLELCDDDLKSHVPEFISDEEIAKDHKYHKDQGLLDVFYREFRNIPISTEDAVFKPEYFRDYEDLFDKIIIPQRGEIKKEVINSLDLINVVICDPAKTTKLSSADSAVLCIGVSRSSRKIFVREVIAGKMEPDELYNAMFDMVKKYNAFILGVEVTSLHRFISQPIESEMRVRSIYPIYIELPATGKKEERVAKLSPLYKLGYVYHNIVQCVKLESQLLMFPRSKLWDVMDALAYIIYIMDKHAIYFDPSDGDENTDADEEEFLELENDEPLRSEAWL